MTLGTFGGYFRTRDRPVSSTFAYNRYAKHYVLGVVYSRVPGIDERRVYDIEDLADIPSVARDFQFFLHEKYRIGYHTQREYEEHWLHPLFGSADRWNRRFRQVGR
jgi:hypothetical protein